MKCALAKCGLQFEQRAPHQIYCSPRCRKGGQNERRTAQRRAENPGAVRAHCAYKHCGREFWRTSRIKRFCCKKCQDTALRNLGLTDELRRPKKRLRCGRCGGRHMAMNCKNLRRNVVKQYGTVDPVTREYVPPPGVAVRVVQITPFVHSDRLAKMLHELDGEER